MMGTLSKNDKKKIFEEIMDIRSINHTDYALIFQYVDKPAYIITSKEKELWHVGYKEGSFDIKKSEVPEFTQKYGGMIVE